MVSKEYLDSIRRYFTIKHKYENDLMALKRKSKKSLKTLPACKGCSRKVGMIFPEKIRNIWYIVEIKQNHVIGKS